MLNNKRVINHLVFGLIALGVAAGVFFASYRFSIKNPGGTDFLVHWIGARAFIFDKLSPYDDEVALRIQTWVYGRPAFPGEHELRVAYPFYSVFIFAPFAIIGDYNVARALWMTVLVFSLGGLALLSAKINNWEPGFWGKVIYFLFTILWYHSIRPLINGNAVIIVAFLFVFSIYALKVGWDQISGVLLAAATIKPQLLILLVPLMLLWGIKQKRKVFILWFSGTMILMVIVSTILIPDWIIQNLQEVIYYPKYNPPGTLGSVLHTWLPSIGIQLGWLLSVIFAVLLLYVWRKSYSNNFDNLLLGICFTLIISQWIGIQTDPGNFIVLFLPLVFLFSKWVEHKRFLWPPIAMGVLLFGLWWVFLSTVDYGYQPQQDPIMFIPLPLFLLIGFFSEKALMVR